MTKPPLRVVNAQPLDGPSPEPGEGLGATPPHNVEAEQCVLGAAMLSASALAEVRPLLDAGDFYRPAHRRVWEAICALADRGAPADPLAVGAEIGPRNLNKVGGAPDLHTRNSRLPLAANAA